MFVHWSCILMPHTSSARHFSFYYHVQKHNADGLPSCEHATCITTYSSGNTLVTSTTFSPGTFLVLYFKNTAVQSKQGQLVN